MLTFCSILVPTRGIVILQILILNQSNPKHRPADAQGSSSRLLAAANPKSLHPKSSHQERNTIHRQKSQASIVIKMIKGTYILGQQNNNNNLLLSSEEIPSEEELMLVTKKLVMMGRSLRIWWRSTGAPTNPLNLTMQKP